MSSPRTVPLLPCGSIAEAERFATAIGFAVEYRQGPPHPYVALRSDDGIELHYFEILGFDAESSHGSCLVVVADPVAILHRWSSGLHQLYGSVPVHGIPRLMRPRNRSSAVDFRGFSLVDVGGNRIRVVRAAALDGDDDPVVVAAARRPEPESAPAPEPQPSEPAPSRPSAFERHGVGAAPQHRLSALVYLAELAAGLGRHEEALVHLEEAERIDATAPRVMAVRQSLRAAGVRMD